MPANARTLPRPVMLASPEERTLPHTPELAAADMATFGGRLKYMRLHRGMTQANLAAAISVSRTALAQWESSGTIMPSLGAIEELSKVLQTTPEWLTFRRGSPEIFYSNRPQSEHTFVPTVTFGATADDMVYGERWGVPMTFLTDTLHVDSTSMVLFRCPDSSVSPAYDQGDLIFVDITDKRLSKSGVFLYWNGDAPALATFQRIPSKTNPQVRITHNIEGKGSGEMTLPENDVEIIGRTKGRLQTGS